jgi:protein disulfide-isomerase
MKKLWYLLLAASMAVSTACLAGDLPYDEHANAAAGVREALAEAHASHKDVLLVFGANWCPDCRALDAALHARQAAALGEKFVLVKVDVGNFDRNLDLARHYEVPLQKGIPAVAMLTGDDRLLYVTRGGELASAHRMSESGIVDFFSHVLAGQTAAPGH